MVVLLAGLCWLAPATAFSGETNIASTVSSNRWLIIVETSRDMRDRIQGLQDAVAGMLNSGMNGQLWRGDTLGIWTFNSHLYTGQFPLQQWTPETEATIFQTTLGFIAHQPYDKMADQTEMVSSMKQLVQDSDVITIILISTPVRPLSGTPFDDQINQIYQQNYAQQKNARMPFITVLRAAGGKLISYTVNMAPWPVQFPPLPSPKKPSPPVTPARANAPLQKRPAPPPLIISGRKSNPPASVAGTTATTPVVSSNSPVGAQSIDSGASAAANSAATLPPESPALPEATRPVSDAPKETPVANPQTSAQPSPEAGTPVAAINSTASGQGSMSAPADTPAPKAPVQMGTDSLPAPAAVHPIDWVIAVLLAAMVSGGVFLLMRRRAPRSSLITRLLDEEKK